MSVDIRNIGGSRAVLVAAVEALQTAVSTAINTVALTVTGASAIDGASLTIANLPTSDPGVAGEIWADSNVLTVSTGA